ncbi:hypothetical protein SAMN05444008_101439 [Cnuella takakiae]|uniref:Uncharacterized protein n=1 Tax=Cnuella takakiae TaxID=1302690 RepID=A0A1M4TLT7_9BACT|nr:hypothetical protein SAMN05444008_101439 [Cnuella takakiae]
MDPKILLGRVLQKMLDQGFSQYANYNRFNYIRHNKNEIVVDRENGQPTKIKFSKILIAIEGYTLNPEWYDCGPSKLRALGLTHITSPIHSMLHLLTKNDYC